MSDRIFYYVNKNGYTDSSSPDIVIPEKLCRENQLEFRVLDPNIPVDEDFEKVYFENNEYATRRYLPHIYNYYLNFGDKVNLPGNTATSGAEWFKGTKMCYSGKRPISGSGKSGSTVSGPNCSTFPSTAI